MAEHVGGTEFHERTLPPLSLSPGTPGRRVAVATEGSGEGFLLDCGIINASEDSMSRVILTLLICLTLPGFANAAKLRAGAAAIDITPTEFPVIVNGMFEERMADKALDPIFAKCIVLDDGTTRIAMVVADSCMLPRDLLDQAKEIASKSTGIPTDRMMISATHTHSAPS